MFFMMMIGSTFMVTYYLFFIFILIHWKAIEVLIQVDWKVTPDFEFYVMQSNVRLQILRKLRKDKHRCIIIKNVFSNNKEYMKS